MLLLWLWAACWNAAALLCGAAAQYSSDECSWRGSGLSHEPHVRDVEQVYLRCAQGSLTWLYPTGAIIVNLRPNTEPSSGGAAGLHACIKPRADSKGAQLYLEQAGDLRVLLGEREQAQGAVRCFSLAQGTLFVEAVAHTDISRRITAFQYELVPSQGPGAHMYPYLHSGTDRHRGVEQAVKYRRGQRLILTDVFTPAGLIYGLRPFDLVLSHQRPTPRDITE
ncbi:Meteorin-like protein [Merluccius polli]|uniref:Meteorin-like protein n=1 Tax=Merluccius polli TaxID=89951 RepID=A0AA47P9B0_MERPO|nr:Meteorin-like protein [Merluccius polli]